MQIVTFWVKPYKTFLIFLSPFVKNLRRMKENLKELH